MSTRIRYEHHPNGDGFLLSVRTFGPQHYRVELDTVNLVYQITSGNAETCITGKAVSVPMLKLRVKAELKRLGVLFDSEDRDRE